MRTNRLKTREKIAYAIGDLGNAFSWSYITSFLMVFYTDEAGISAAAVGTLFLVTRIWDAINDPMVGTLSDQTKSKWGRYRPWLLFGCIPLAILTSLVFYNPTSYSQTDKLIYAYIVYSLVVLAYTAVNIPYTALSATITQDPKERGSLAGWRLCFSIIGAMITAQVGTLLVPALGNQGYFKVAVILSSIAVICYLITFTGTRERVVIPKKKEHISISEQLKVCLKNKPLLLTTAAHFVVGLTVYGKMAVIPYYFKYYVGDYSLMVTFRIVMQLAMACGSIYSPKLSEKLNSKGKALGLSFLLYGSVSILNYFISVQSMPVLFWILIAVENFFHGCGYAISYAVIPDTVEYGVYKTGVRNDGFITSLTSFFNKVGMAIGTSATAYILAALNYNPNGIQTSSTLTSINFIMFAVSGIGSLIIAILFRNYTLDYQTFQKIVQKLETDTGGEYGQSKR